MIYKLKEHLNIIWSPNIPQTQGHLIFSCRCQKYLLNAWIYHKMLANLVNKFLTSFWSFQWAWFNFSWPVANLVSIQERHFQKTLLFGLGIIIIWKSYDLLKKAYSRLFRDLIQLLLLTKQHNGVINICSPNRLTHCVTRTR